MTPDLAPADAVWTIIIPVKETSVAKTRLSGFSQRVRSALALAFALDAATAALASPWVRDVVVVTNDGPAGAALARLGARIVADVPDAGLNPAIVHGAQDVRRTSPAAPLAVMSGDLPALLADDLSAALRAGGSLPHWFVPDAEGLGTTVLAAGAGADLSPAFGVGSRDAHRTLGAIEIAEDGLARLRRDVDVESQLWAAVELGVGAFTRNALLDLGLVATPCR